MSKSPFGGSSVGQTSKKRTSPLEVGSPAMKKTATSIEECVNHINDTVTRLEVSHDEAELAVVFKILKQDGIIEGTPLHANDVILCKDAVN